MAPLKRKRPHDAMLGTSASEPIARRATRQSSDAPLPVQSDPEPRRHRRRGSSTAVIDSLRSPHSKQTLLRTRDVLSVPRHRGKENIPLPSVGPEDVKATRLTRHGGSSLGVGQRRPKVESPNSSHNGHGAITTSIPTGLKPTQATISSRDHAVPVNGSAELHRHASGTPKRQSVTTNLTPSPRSQAKLTQIQPQKPSQRRQSDTERTAPAASKPQNAHPDRNIDKVVLGNLCFRAWYPSYYGKEVVGDISGNSSKHRTSHMNGADHKSDTGGRGHSRRDKDNTPMLDRLYVCPCCFKYSKELVAWWEHVRLCETRSVIPGKKIYVHPKGWRKVFVPVSHTSKSLKGTKRRDVGVRVAETLVQNEGEWSVWEVDGEKDVLFCQNLSLFAKLFLDNKSVFFDVTGFNYFLLVYTLPAPRPSNTAGSGSFEATQPRNQIVGFFSKEKLSWDNNNLACILVFPPWQRKGLGALLMGISYEISRREGVLGGPEKPISDLGKKGYKRFWAGEIARWLLSLDLGDGGGETVIDVGECSKATWIAPEDCVLVLREMNVVEDAGLGPPRLSEAPGDIETVEGGQKSVQRVRIDKEAVRRWVVANRISLERVCDPDGFVDGYALKCAVAPDEEA
ncbi:hypothetical protein VTK73DRAFT_6775 [Phialemonium thermophilum]|uniref:histone acetyltransferase n=1 Tax=Phialemonium thermophilum TaxID=223376 RepID=A0ABR3Y735_9PEZI